ACGARWLRAQRAVHRLRLRARAGGATQMSKQSLHCALVLSSILLLGSTSSSAQTQTVHVLTWNIHHNAAAAQQQMMFIASLNPHPDIIVLQEARDSQRTLYKDTLGQNTPYASWVDEFARYCDNPPGPNNTCTSFDDGGVAV